MSYEPPPRKPTKYSSASEYSVTNCGGSSPIRDRTLTCTRVLGQLLEAPSTRARDNIIAEVDACQGDDDRLYQLGKMFLEHLIRLFKKNMGRPPKPFHHSWRQSFETEKERMKEMILRTGDPSSHYESTKKCVSINTISRVANSNKDAKREYAASIWAVIKAFGYDDIPDKLSGNGIHDVDNIS